MISNPKILIVDDDEDLLEMVTLVLTKKHFEVFAISDWQKIYDSIKYFNPSIILLDIYLGTMDGRRLCRELREDPNFKSLPIILYSAGQITPDSIEESLATDFITKPFDIEFLTTKLMTRLDLPVIK